jgi:hypothetical protein
MCSWTRSHLLEVAALTLLALTLHDPAAGQVFDYDDSTLQGWTMDGLRDDSGTYHANPFVFAWDDETQFPGPPFSDPLGNGLGAAEAAASNIFLPGTFPDDAFWFIDFRSPALTSDPNWQGITGVAHDIRCTNPSSTPPQDFFSELYREDGFWVQLLLEATRLSDGQTAFLAPTDFSGAFVFHRVSTDSLTSPLQDPWNWMSLYHRFADLSPYDIDHVVLRIWGPSGNVQSFGLPLGPGACHVDNVRSLTGGTEIGVQGKVTMALTARGGCGAEGPTHYQNDITIQFDSDYAGTPRLASASLDLTGSNVGRATISPAICDVPIEPHLQPNWTTDQNLLLGVSGFDAGEKIRYSTALRRFSGGGEATGADMEGATVSLSFAGLPSSCVIPAADFVAETTYSASAYFECAAPDSDGDGYTADVDCDDGNPNINPAATEVCDGVDNNCAGGTDEGIEDIISGTDVGACEVQIEQCIGGSFQVVQPGVSPSAEICDGIDNNCEGTIDDPSLLDFDADMDGANSLDSCHVPVDCDDGNPDLQICNTPMTPDPFMLPAVTTPLGDATFELPNVTGGGDSMTNIVDCNDVVGGGGLAVSANDICVEVETTATFDGFATVCIPYQDDGTCSLTTSQTCTSDAVCPTGEVCVDPLEASRRMVRFPDDGNRPVVLATASHDFVNNILCAFTDEFSGFAQGQLTDGDGDLAADLLDNCPDDYNFFQDDEDGDAVGDICDNCKFVENGPGAGTCVFGDPGIIGAICYSTPECGGGWGFCTLDQEDTDLDGLGIACDPEEVPEPGLLPGLLAGWLGLVLVARRGI